MRPIKKRPETNYAFIDSQNLNMGTQKMGWKMDWRRFRRFLEEKYGVSKAYMFIGYLAENEAMYEQLHDAGYLIVLKPTVETTSKPDPKASNPAPGEKPADGKPQPPVRTIKGNIDAELVLYAMKELPNYKKAVIVSGDGDFYCLVEYLAEKGRLQNIMAPNWQYSSLLKPYEKHIIRIDKLRRELAYHDRKKH
jgi:uncharacterized LabA/DUF88 family protein